jgi:NADH-quinone oxidoreductase subunit L
MVSSANLVMLFVFWQLVSWLLFLLAHNHAHAATLQGACKTFTLLRAGDAAFLAGIVLAHALYGTVEFRELFERAAAMPVLLSPVPGIEISGATAVTLLIFVGAMSKSAQFPIHIWLPHFLYAPTPVSALLHAGIINAGGFLLNRLAPLYGLSPTTLHVVFVVGMLTAVLGASMMLVQNDIKKTLGFSTIGQMGYMIMECGLGAFALAVFHLIAHGLFKATAFLNCGDVIHRVRQEPASPHARHAVTQYELLGLTWATGFFTTLLLPFVILLVTHGVLRIPLLESQGTLVFLFFIWVTSSQAILTLTRLRAVASWKVSVAMLVTLLFVVFTYLFAAEAFTHFLYPDPQDVERYFKAAALPGRLFDGLVGGTTLLIVLGWVYLYAQAHGRTMRLPDEVQALRIRLYVLLKNQLYIDGLHDRFGRGIMRLTHGLDKHSIGRLR